VTALLTPPDNAEPVEVPRRIARRSRHESARLAATAAAAVALTALAFVATPLAGSFGFVVVAAVAFVGLATFDARVRLGGPAGSDRAATIVVVACAGLAVAALLEIVWFVLSKGVQGVSVHFFTQTLDAVGPLDPPTAGGAKHAIIGTAEQVGMATFFATPLGLTTAVYLGEYPGRMTRLVRFLVDSMSGVPSIVAGLFVYTMWVLRMGRGFSGLAGAMALTVLMLPTVARTAEEMLKLVPGGLRESSLALGAPRWRTITKVILPTARSGLVTAVILGIARIAGETAPLLMTAFGTDSVNANPTDGPQSALPLFIYSRVRNAVPAAVTRGWAAALVLILLVLILFTLARALGSRAGKAA
jgi:phosphate transport system permease protein